MEAIQKARELYTTKSKLDNQTSPDNDNRNLTDDIHRYISVAVKSASSASDLFHNCRIFESLISALYVCVVNENGVASLVRAYRCLEKYFILLMQQPWKPEYRTLKTYGGFYKTKIKSVISNAEVIFTLAGYEADFNNTLVYRKAQVDKQSLITLSFDCFVASEICERIGERHNQLKTVGKTLDDAISDLLQSSWPRDSGREKSFMLDNKSSLNGVVPPEVPKREPVLNGFGSKKISHKTVLYPQEPSLVYDASIQNQDPVLSLGNFKLKSNTDSHVPFIDEPEHYPKLSQATPEEHMRESIKLMAEQESKYGKDALLKSSPAPSYDVTKSLFYDQGYGTGSTYSSGQEMMSYPIHRPPAIDSKMNIGFAAPVMKGHAMPPPIPSRDLKPTLRMTGNEDVVDGPVMGKYSDNGLIVQPSKVLIPPSHDTSLPIGALNIGNGLRPQLLLHQMKSKSLKSDSKKLVSDTRATKSMDYQTKSCPRCTLDNRWSSINCDACGEVLP